MWVSTHIKQDSTLNYYTRKMTGLNYPKVKQWIQYLQHQIKPLTIWIRPAFKVMAQVAQSDTNKWLFYSAT